MRARRDAALRLLKTMLVASIVIPVTVFAYASWINYQNAVARADEQLAASLNILSQHASGIFQSVDLTFTAVDAILGDLTDDVLLDNDSAWSADHCTDALEVPGVLCCNRPIKAHAPSLIDIAPSILAEFGLPTPQTMNGKSVFV